MKRHALMSVIAGLLVISVGQLGCSDDDDGEATGGTGGATGGTGGGATGGTGGGGTGGTDGGATGGTDGSANVGAFWPAAFTAGCTPNEDQPSATHQVGNDCMTCHGPNGSQSTKLLYGGTAYNAAGTGPAAGAEVGVSDGTNVHVACVDDNGNFWVVANGASLTWTNAEARIRNANGEEIMQTPATAACNSCHTSALRITAP